MGASRLDLSSLGRPSTASERQRSRAGQRQAGPSCSVCRQPPLAPARPCSPRCTCWTWNLGGTSSHTWTASRCAEASALEFPAGGEPARPKPTCQCVPSSSSVDPRLLACPCCLPASCGWCTPRSQGSGWNSCWSRAPSTSLGTGSQGAPTPPVTPEMPTQHFEHLLSFSPDGRLYPPPQALCLEQGLPSPHPATASIFSCRGSARYDFSHEILRDEESFFGERRVPRGRRISVICRSLPEGMGPGEPGQLPPPC